MAGEEVDTPERKRRLAHLLANEIGLSRDDRHALVEWILHRDVSSWRELKPEDYDRILDALSGYQAITHLLTS